jgi:hypothetical protein
MTSLRLITAAMLMLVFGITTAAFAGTSTATATVSATIVSVTSVSLTRDTNSVTRGSTNMIVFDRLDSVDKVGGDAGSMYAPYRSEENKNWHIANIVANGSTTTLAMATTGSVGTTPLSSILSVWSGGFFTPGATTPITGTASTVWEFANGWQRSLSQPFTGTVPFNYRLSVGGVSAGVYSGSITVTLTTT